MMTEPNNDVRRMTLSLTPELDRAITELRKTEEFCRCSYAEIIRMLMTRGLERSANNE